MNENFEKTIKDYEEINKMAKYEQEPIFSSLETKETTLPPPTSLAPPTSSFPPPPG